MKKLIDPFKYFSGGATLAAGVAGMLVMVVLARLFGATFRGVVSEGIGTLSYWQLALQQAAGWGVFSLLLYVAARLFSRSKIRAVDVFGYQALARIPFVFVLLGSALPTIRQAMEGMMALTPEELMTQSPDELVTSAILLVITIFGLFSLLMLVWFFWWSYRGFATAANLKGGKAAAIYVGCYLLAEAGAGWCTASIASW